MNNYLTDRRKELGLTMKEVACAVGVSEATVSRWESGAIANMRRDKIAKYAAILSNIKKYNALRRFIHNQTRPCIPDKC